MVLYQHKGTELIILLMTLSHNFQPPPTEQICGHSLALSTRSRLQKMWLYHHPHHSVHYLALKMSSSSHQTINKFSILLRMPSQPHQYCLTLMPVSLPTCLQMLAARALASLYIQQNTANTWNLIQAGSQLLKVTKSKYAVTELEMLVVCWAVSKCTF